MHYAVDSSDRQPFDILIGFNSFSSAVFELWPSCCFFIYPRTSRFPEGPPTDKMQTTPVKPSSMGNFTFRMSCDSDSHWLLRSFIHWLSAIFGRFANRVCTIIWELGRLGCTASVWWRKSGPSMFIKRAQYGFENQNSWQSCWPDNKEWHWTAFAILVMFSSENPFSPVGKLVFTGQSGLTLI